MATPLPRPEAPTPFEIRFLSGPQAGASLPAAAGRPTRVSHLWDGDVVLRNSAQQPVAFDIEARGRRVWVHVRVGPLQVGELTLSAGEEAEIDCCTPIQVGDVAIALGPRDDASWQAAASAPASAPAAPPPAPLAAWPRWLTLSGAVALALAGLAFAFQHVGAAPVETRAQALQRAQALLAGGGWADARVRENERGQLELGGRFASQASRQSAMQALAGVGLVVEPGGELIRPLDERVREVLRANGVGAEVSLLAPDAVRVVMAVEESASLKAQAAVRSDVSGLGRLEWVNQAPSHDVPGPGPEGPGKRIAAVVPGDPAYVVTADGARYFAGAVLPSGHVIRAIEGREVLLEKEGKPSRLKF